MLCSVYGAKDSKKNRNKRGWKMAMPFNYTSKEKSYSNTTMSIAAGLDK